MIQQEQLKFLWLVVMNNLHSLLFLVGLIIINVAIYMVNPIAGLIATGVFTVSISFLLNANSGKVGD